jgi:16S rRNA (guanine966-N2)-methyltransferase
MRIIAGEFRGRTLVSVPDLSIRPTTDRAKQTIFDILNNRVDFDGVHVLDLFAGSGSLGLEALSRGAKHVTFVEKSRKSLEVLEKNVRALGCEESSTRYQADVFWYLKNANTSFDLVFVDPPYKLEAIGSLPNAIYDSHVLKNGVYVVMEFSKESKIDLNPERYEILTKSFGQTNVLILKAQIPPQSPGA